MMASIKKLVPPPRLLKSTMTINFSNTLMSILGFLVCSFLGSSFNILSSCIKLLSS